MTATLPFEPGLVPFVIFVENTLGWTPQATDTKPLWKVRALEAYKLRKKIATNPKLYTWENLALTVEWLRRQQKSVGSPAAVCWEVERALKEAYQPATPIDVQKQIDEAIKWEQGHQLPNFREWIGRLTRAGFGRGQRDTVAEWRETRGTS